MTTAESSHTQHTRHSITPRLCIFHRCSLPHVLLSKGRSKTKRHGLISLVQYSQTAQGNDNFHTQKAPLLPGDLASLCLLTPDRHPRNQGFNVHASRWVFQCAPSFCVFQSSKEISFSWTLCWQGCSYCIDLSYFYLRELKK